ncbi:hypothetical protein [Listeria booriae]|uniref:hypothetical protein n=1 Tax=Listeria booriae TaxID=1552123 RepID=UPI0016284E50|nr:hypothetical protein [Listeria booriae]MBC2171024.1 hypothetical protein [Listeria booriae]MBC2174026.1 hypothetical protein [Listeria booriae]
MSNSFNHPLTKLLTTVGCIMLFGNMIYTFLINAEPFLYFRSPLFKTFTYGGAACIMAGAFLLPMILNFFSFTGRKTAPITSGRLVEARVNKWKLLNKNSNKQRVAVELTILPPDRMGYDITHRQELTQTQISKLQNGAMIQVLVSAADPNNIQIQ